jgi:hypothetical protein
METKARLLFLQAPRFAFFSNQAFRKASMQKINVLSIERISAEDRGS